MPRDPNSSQPRRQPWPSQEIGRRQHALLRLVAEGRSLGSARRELGIRERTLSGWMRRATFRRYLRETLAGARALREERLLQASIHAAEALAAAAAGELDLGVVRHRACVEVIRLARAAEADATTSDAAADPPASSGDAAYADGIAPDIARALAAELASHETTR